jgi:hypothetical protein
MVLYYCLLVAVLVVVALLNEICEVASIHDLVIIDTIPSHMGGDIVQLSFI